MLTQERNPNYEDKTNDDTYYEYKLHLANDYMYVSLILSLILS